jgi:flagellar protein FliO/FliZ
MGDASLWGLLARLVISLAVVLGLMVGAAWVIRRRGGSLMRRIGRGLPLEVMARQSLGRAASVQVVRLGERAVVLGVTEHQVTYLTEGDPAEFETVDLTGMGGPSADRTARSGGESLGSSWTGVMESLRDRTTRR